MYKGLFFMKASFILGPQTFLDRRCIGQREDGAGWERVDDVLGWVEELVVVLVVPVVELVNHQAALPGGDLVEERLPRLQPSSPSLQ